MSAQGKKRLKKRHFKKIAPFVLVIFSTFFLAGYIVFKLLTRDLAAAFSTTAQNALTGDVYSVFYIPSHEGAPSHDVILFVVDQSKEKILATSFPLHYKIDATGKFGHESLQNIFVLGQAAFGGQVLGGVELLSDSMKSAAGFRIDRYLYATGTCERIFEKVLDLVSKDTLLPLKALVNAKEDLVTDFAVPEFYAFVEDLGRFDIEHYDFTTWDDFDKNLATFTYASELALENKSVAVLNGTSTSGVASVAARVVSNAGGRVIEVDNASKEYSGSMLVVDSKSSRTATYMSSFFGVTNVVEKGDSTIPSEAVTDRVDITLIVGLDIVEDL